MKHRHCGLIIETSFLQWTLQRRGHELSLQPVSFWSACHVSLQSRAGIPREGAHEAVAYKEFRIEGLDVGHPDASMHALKSYTLSRMSHAIPFWCASMSGPALQVMEANKLLSQNLKEDCCLLARFLFPAWENVSSENSLPGLHDSFINKHSVLMPAIGKY